MNRKGSLGLVAILLLASITSAYLTLFYVRDRWLNIVSEQRELDQCTGKAALETKKMIEQIEALNRKIVITRVAITSLLASGQAQLVPPLRITLAGCVTLQNSIRIKWEWLQTRWIGQIFCQKPRALHFPVSPFPWTRPPPDHIGRHAYKWKSKQQHKFLFRLQTKRNRSLAKLSKNSKDSWHARWE